MSAKRKLRTFGALLTDEDAERAIESEDLTQFDLSGLHRVSIEFERKAAQVNLRIPQALLEHVKRRAEARGIPYTRYIREVLERDLRRG